MTGIAYLDVAIGVIYAFVVFSLVATSFQEALAGLFRWRAAALRQGVKRLLEDQFERVWEHPIIDGLKGPNVFFGDGKRDPSYVPADLYAKATLDSLGLLGLSAREIEQRLAGATDAASQRIRAILSNVEDTREAAEKALAHHFDQMMDRVRGWYVRRAKFVLFFIGVGLSAAINFNVITYAGGLLADSAKRERIVQMAEQIEDLDSMMAKIKGEDADLGIDRASLDLVVASSSQQLTDALGDTGWNCGDKSRWACFKSLPSPLYAVLSWLIMGLAVMLGAQFWFDLLKRFVSIRSSGVDLANAVARKKADREEPA